MAASVHLGEARPSSSPLPEGWAIVDVAPVEAAGLVEDPEPLEERRYGITDAGRRALLTAYACDRGPSVAEVMARGAE